MKELGLGESITLKVVRTGTDKVNFKILKLAKKRMNKKESGTKINEIIKETGLSKVPVNNRINELERVGLVKRWRGTGLVILTDLGKILINKVEEGEDLVRDGLMEMLNRLS